MLKKNSTGFTLMELLIVLIIMGVLAATGIATYTRAVERKKGEVTANNIRMIMAAWKIYNSKQIAGDEYDPEVDSPPGFVGINDLNTDLGIIIDERNFGNALNAGFFMGYNDISEDYAIVTRRLTGSHATDYIYCLYNNGTYTWGGTPLSLPTGPGSDWFNTFPTPD